MIKERSIKTIKLKKILPLLISLTLSFGGFAQSTTITIELDIPEPSVEITPEGFATVNIDGARQLGRCGTPSLPYLPLRTVLPPGHEAKSATFSGRELKVISTGMELRPMPETRTFSGGPPDDQPGSPATYQMPPSVSYPSTGFYKGVSLAHPVFTPVVYDAQTKTVSCYGSVEIRIVSEVTAEGTAALSNLDRKGAGEIREMGMIHNKASLGEYPKPGSRTTGYDMLIITPEQFTASFDTLIEFYKQRGFKVGTVSVGHADTAGTGQDKQERIRDFIISEYQSSGIEYLLLGGDTNFVPSRGFYCIVQKPDGTYYPDDYNIPADLYYAALDGNWNTDGDTKWAEPGEDDLYPELSVGRMPFSDTVELNNLLNKTMRYQSAPVVPDLQKPLLAGEHLWNDPLTWGADYMELLVGNRSDNGYTTLGIPPGHDLDSLYARSASWSKYSLMNLVNQGISAIHHCGHANYTYVMKLYNSDITNSNFSQANGIDHHFPVVYTHGCMCGGFDKSDCIGERMVNIDNFASAFIGNSRYGWFVEGTSEGPAEHLHREFMDAVYNDTLYWIGRALKESKIMTAPWVDLPDEYEPGAFRWNFYDLNILGDPLMAMWTWQPQPFAAGFRQILPAGADSLEVTLSKNGQPLKNFRCAIIQGDSIFGSATTDSTGTALIDMTSDLVIGDAFLKISGYNILLETFDLVIADYWLGVNPDWSDPQNWFSGSIPNQNTDVVITDSPAGGYFPMENSLGVRNCRNLHIEQGAGFEVVPGETLRIWPE